MPGVEVARLIAPCVALMFSPAVDEYVPPPCPVRVTAAVPVAQGTVISDTTIQLLNIPGSKAVYVNYYGAYDKTTEAYASIDKYLSANNLKQKAPVIEQYITDPKIEKDTAKWLTKIIFLVE